MTQKHWMNIFLGFVVLGSFAAGARAQEMPESAAVSSSASVAPASHGHFNRTAGKAGAYGFLASLQKNVGLTPEQTDSVRGLLAQQRQKSQALREETDSKIRELLSPEQQKKFDSYLAEQKANRARRFEHS